MLLFENKYGFGRPKVVYILLCIDLLLKKTNHTPATKCILEKGFHQRHNTKHRIMGNSNSNNEDMVCKNAAFRKWRLTVTVSLAIMGIGVCVWSIMENLHRSTGEIILGILFAIALIIPIVTLFKSPPKTLKLTGLTKSEQISDQHCISKGKATRNLIIIVLCTLFAMLILIGILSLPGDNTFVFWEILILTIPLVLSGIQTGFLIRESYNTDPMNVGLNATKLEDGAVNTNSGHKETVDIPVGDPTDFIPMFI